MPIRWSDQEQIIRDQSDQQNKDVGHSAINQAQDDSNCGNENWLNDSFGWFDFYGVGFLAPSLFESAWCVRILI